MAETIVDEISNRSSVVYNEGVFEKHASEYIPFRILNNWEATIDEEGLYNRFDLRDGNGVLLKSTVSFVAPEPQDETATASEQARIDEVNSYSNFDGNKYGKATKSVVVSVTPNASLAETYPYALVRIDGKEYDLSKLSGNLVFNMESKDHFIDILWTRGVVESFRIVGNR